MSRTVTLFSFHLYRQRRRGGMHWLCDAFRELGWQARFITCDYSWVTRLKGDRRTEFGEPLGLNRLCRVDDSLQVGVVHSPFHQLGRAGTPAGRLMDALTSRYPFPMQRTISRFAKGSDLVLVESCGALTYIPIVRRATRAPIVYRVSDNLQVIRPVPSLLRAEAAAVESVELVSLASDHLARRFAASGSRIRLHPMGLQKEIFDACERNPYDDNGRKRVVISGSSGLDGAALVTAARLFPQWDFVLFGSTRLRLEAPNIHQRGEVPFAELVPWVKHADIGFAPYLQQEGFEYQAEHSNRLLQYTYSGLPSVVPRQLCSAARPHFFGYAEPANEPAMHEAFSRAAAQPRQSIPVDSVLDWRQVAGRIVDDVGLLPPREIDGVKARA